MSYYVSKVSGNKFNESSYWHYIKNKRVKNDKTSVGDIFFCYYIKSKEFVYAVEFESESLKSDMKEFCFMRKIKKYKMNFTDENRAKLEKFFSDKNSFYHSFKYWQDITSLDKPTTNKFVNEKLELLELLKSCFKLS